MAPSPSPDRILDRAEIEALVDIAEATITAALLGGEPILPSLADLPSALHDPIGAFVTLTVAGELNGCIGTVEAVEPVGHAVARLALSAAFADPRLPALRRSDYPHLTIEVSVLSALSPIGAASHAELLAEVRPARDGVVIKAGGRQGLFLPSVWEQLPDPEDFLDQLWRKAGLTPRTWPAELRPFRFTTQRHGRRAGAGQARSVA
jgi:AmmeMemoRadiSam system protein A